MKAYNLKAIQATIGEKLVSVISLGEKGRGRAQKLIRCEQGITDGEQVVLKCPKPGMPGAISITKGNDEQSSSDWLMRISTEASYVRGANGNVSVLDGEGVTLVTKGYGAFGDAGRIGSWDDVLVCASPGAILRVKPSRGDAYFLRVTEDGIIGYSKEEADFDGIQTEKEKYFRI